MKESVQNIQKSISISITELNHKFEPLNKRIETNEEAQERFKQNVQKSNEKIEENKILFNQSIKNIYTEIHQLLDKFKMNNEEFKNYIDENINYKFQNSKKILEKLITKLINEAFDVKKMNRKVKA